ncbi:hypothetical protein [Halomonas sp.]|uniref:Uncharacterized protein n=2 Tax=Halomonas ventosae TaxID=229007 RepID=A0A4R6I5J3_9GAMM|nr:hypothetical protein DFO68_10184 [Halomonas ventosae]
MVQVVFIHRLLAGGALADLDAWGMYEQIFGAILMNIKAGRRTAAMLEVSKFANEHRYVLLS